MHNSQEGDLKRRLRSIKGKISRRERTMAEMRAEVHRLHQERRVIEEQLRDYRK